MSSAAECEHHAFFDREDSHQAQSSDSNVPKGLPHSSSSATLPPKFFSSSSARTRRVREAEKEKRTTQSGIRARSSNTESGRGSGHSTGGRGGGLTDGRRGTEEENEADSESDSIESIYKRLSGSHLAESPTEQVSPALKMSYFSERTCP